MITFRHSCAIASSLACIVFAATLSLRAQSSCISSSGTTSQSGPGVWRFVAGTSQTNCSGRTNGVWAWIQGQSYSCSGPRDADGTCYDISGPSSAVTTTFQTSVCGSATGISWHEYDDGTWHFLASPQGIRTTALLAGLCVDPDPDLEAECAAQGDQYYWNGDKCAPRYCPILIATDKAQSYTLTPADRGVAFDIDGDGSVDQIAWTEPDSEVAFLAFDRDGDGRITSGRELFGDHTLPGVPNGFEALRLLNLESNGGIERGSVSSDDPIYARLLLWTDRNHNGISEPSELRPARELISDIGLGYVPYARRDGSGNRFRFRGWVHVRTASGRNFAWTPNEDRVRRRYIYDVFLTTARR